MKINLLPVIPKSKRYKWHGIISLGIVMLVLSTFATFQIWQGFELLKEKRQVLEQIKLEVNQKQTSVSNNLENNQRFADYLDSYASLKANHITLIPFMDEISQLLPKHGYITNLEWSEKEETIGIKGVFMSLDQVGDYIQLLEELEWIDRVDLISMKKTNGIEFELLILIHDSDFLEKGVMEND